MARKFSQVESTRFGHPRRSSVRLTEQVDLAPVPGPPHGTRAPLPCHAPSAALAPGTANQPFPLEHRRNRCGRQKKNWLKKSTKKGRRRDSNSRFLQQSTPVVSSASNPHERRFRSEAARTRALWLPLRGCPASGHTCTVPRPRQLSVSGATLPQPAPTPSIRLPRCRGLHLG